MGRAKTHPALVKKMEDKEADEKTRMLAVARIGQIASLRPETTMKRKAEKKLLETWFSSDADVNSKLGKS